jgi:hypothetical protein
MDEKSVSHGDEFSILGRTPSTESGVIVGRWRDRQADPRQLRHGATADSRAVFLAGADNQPIGGV